MDWPLAVAVGRKNARPLEIGGGENSSRVHLLDDDDLLEYFN